MRPARKWLRHDGPKLQHALRGTGRVDRALAVRSATAQDVDLYRKTLQEFSVERQQQNAAIQVQIASLRTELAQAPRDSRLPPGTVPPGTAPAGRQPEQTGKLRELELQLEKVRSQLSDTQAAYEEQKLFVQELAAELGRAKGDLDPQTYQRALDALATGDTNLAEELLQQVLEKRREQAKSAAVAAYQLGRIKEIDRLDFRAAADLYNEAARYDPATATYVIAAAKNAYFLGRLPEAERLFESVEQSAGITPIQRAQILVGIGETYRTRGAYDKAEAAFKKALELLGPTPEDVALAATAHNYLGLVYWFEGRHAEADASLATALRILGDRTDKPSLTARGSALNSRAAAIAEIGDMSAAEPLYKEALETRKKLFPATERDPMAASYMNNLALLYRYAGRFDEAHELLRRARSGFERAYGTGHPRVATAIANQAATFCVEGKTDEAWPLANQALALREKLFGPSSPPVAESIVMVGYLQRLRHEPDQAEQAYLRALEIRKKLPKTAGLDHAKTLAMLGNLHVEQKRLKDAVAVLHEAVEIEDALQLPASPVAQVAVKHILVSYAAALSADGKADAAQAVTRKAAAITATAVGDCAR
jgi:tetratricopeptide (TPR) repeat protein